MASAACDSQPVPRIANRAALLDYFSNERLTCRLSVKRRPAAGCLWMGLSLIATVHPNCDGLTVAASESKGADDTTEDTKSASSLAITALLDCEEVTVQLESKLVKELIGYDVDKNETNVQVLNVRFESPNRKYKIDISEYDVTITFASHFSPHEFQQFLRTNLTFIGVCKSEEIKVRYVTEMDLNDHVEVMMATSGAQDLKSTKLDEMKVINTVVAQLKSVDVKTQAVSATATANTSASASANLNSPQVPNDPIQPQVVQTSAPPAEVVALSLSPNPQP